MNFDFSNEILPDSPESIYLQLFNIIQKQIEDGKLVPGDMLPSEMEFCSAYHISRTTVRQALHELELIGAIERKRGHYNGLVGLDGFCDLETVLL